jgi:hypothetical protein
MMDLEEFLAGPNYLNDVPGQIHYQLESSVQSSLLFVFLIWGIPLIFFGNDSDFLSDKKRNKKI